MCLQRVTESRHVTLDVTLICNMSKMKELERNITEREKYTNVPEELNPPLQSPPSFRLQCL